MGFVPCTASNSGKRNGEFCVKECSVMYEDCWNTGLVF